jgi:hypothetical protein
MTFCSTSKGFVVHHDKKNRQEIMRNERMFIDSTKLKQDAETSERSLTLLSSVKKKLQMK